MTSGAHFNHEVYIHKTITGRSLEMYCFVSKPSFVFSCL